MVKYNLSLDDFANFDNFGRHGALYFPNGLCFSESRGKKLPYQQFHIQLEDLFNALKMVEIHYKLNENQKDKGNNHTDDLGSFVDYVLNYSPSFDDFIGVIVYGPAVNSADDITKVIQPYYADFLVLSKENDDYHINLNPLLFNFKGYLKVKKGGIHIGVRNFESVKKDLNNDSFLKSIFENGVPIMYDNMFVAYLSEYFNHRKNKIKWYDYSDSSLIGLID
ncbi:MAG: hypothetical protein GWP09_00810 [Nitrospiraceae bacterium]|nr:hypothetical protein [Nitrospiraceae bacterium]